MSSVDAVEIRKNYVITVVDKPHLVFEFGDLKKNIDLISTFKTVLATQLGVSEKSFNLVSKKGLIRSENEITTEESLLQFTEEPVLEKLIESGKFDNKPIIKQKQVQDKFENRLHDSLETRFVEKETVEL